MYNMTTAPRKLSYKFQTNIDPRDYKIQAVGDNILLSQNGINTINKASIIPSKFTIPFLATILDQGYLGSCVANAASLAVSTQSVNKINLSRLMLYALCRINDNTSLNNDAGTTVKSCCNTLKKYGVCPETLYPYVINKFSVLPPLSAFKGLNLLNNFVYYTVNKDLKSLKQCLVTLSSPIIFGIMVYDSFLSIKVATSGIVPMPNLAKEKLQGGHCITMIGYDDSRSCFLCANSWGTSWGIKGLFYLPYAYVLNPKLASDFYRITFTPLKI